MYETRKLYEPEKPFVKLRPAYFVKLVFSYVVKGIKIKISSKFRDPERLRFEDTKRILCHPKSFGTFKKRAFGDNLIPRVLSLPSRKEGLGNRTDDYVVDRIVN